jgi:hypothetical protein
MQLPDTLRRLAAAGTTDAVSKCRIDIDDAVKGGTLAADAAAALDAVARLVAADIAANGARTAKPTQATNDDRLPAVIREAMDAEYPDSGPIIRGVVAVTTGDGEQMVRFRIKRSWDGSVKALFGAAGLSPDDDPGQLVGAAIEVTMGSYAGANGPMPVVKRWHKPAAPAKAATAKPAAPAWESDEAAAPRAPRRTTAQKAHAAFKANVAAAAPEDDDTIPF